MAQHVTPSTYILRDLIDIAPIEPVSWFPQTLTWKLLIVLFCIIFIVLCIRYLHSVWMQRYRKEAHRALVQLTLDSNRFEYQLFFIMKRVLGYVVPDYSTKSDREFLTALDVMQPKEQGSQVVCVFTCDLGMRWMQALLSPAARLSNKERMDLLQLCQVWIDTHHIPVQEKGEC